MADSYLAALAQVVDEYVDRPNNESAAHTAYIGLQRKDGVYLLDEPDAIVVQVPHTKAEFASHAVGDKELPPEIMYKGERIEIDVQAGMPQPKIELLLINGNAEAHAYVETQAGEAHRKCFSPLVVGGCQIQPPPGQWVGTLGGMLGFEQEDGSVEWGFVTNAHVAGIDANAGQIVGQPTHMYGCGRLLKRHVIDFAPGAKNLVDLACYSARGQNGKLHCSPQFVDGTWLAAKWGSSMLREKHQKDGRTTGHTEFMCVGVQGVSSINYGAGRNARFVDLDIHAMIDGGDPSAPGDSGSMIRSLEGNEFRSLLFAGGGGQTLSIPARNVITACRGKLYSGDRP